MRPKWQVGEPPRDLGRAIVILGALRWDDGDEGWSEPVCCEALWRTDATIPGWHFVSNGLAIAQTEFDELHIHFWSEIPGSDSHKAAKAKG